MLCCGRVSEGTHQAGGAVQSADVTTTGHRVRTLYFNECHIYGCCLCVSQYLSDIFCGGGLFFQLSFDMKHVFKAHDKSRLFLELHNALSS